MNRFLPRCCSREICRAAAVTANTHCNIHSNMTTQSHAAPSAASSCCIELLHRVVGSSCCIELLHRVVAPQVASCSDRVCIGIQFFYDRFIPRASICESASSPECCALVQEARDVCASGPCSRLQPICRCMDMSTDVRIDMRWACV